MKTAIILGLTLLAPGLSGQTFGEYIVQGKAKIEAAVSAWDQGDMLEVRAHFERVLALGEKEWLLHYYIAYCDYQLSTYALSVADNKSARRLVNDGLMQLKRSIQDNPEFADAYALISSFYGLKIALRPWAVFLYGPLYGPKVSWFMVKALALGPANPRIHLLQGISFYHTPFMFGGGKKKARKALEEAIRFYAVEEADPLMPDWGHSEAYGWLGLTELGLGDSTSAGLYFKKALDIDPENSWVRYHLLPLLTKNESP